MKVDHGSYDGTLLRIFDSQFTAIAEGAPLPQVEPFKNFIDWVHHEDRNSDLAYWLSELASYEPTHDLPQAPVSDRLEFVSLAADVDAIASKFGATTSTVFQGAYALIAGHLIGTSDVLIDNLITGRNAGVGQPQLVNGTCANFLPLRTQLSSSTSVSRFMRDMQAAFWDMMEHGALGLHDIYKTLGRSRATHGARLLFCFQPFEPAPAGAAVNHMRWVVMAQSMVFMTINYALMVEVQKTVRGYRLKLQWDSRAFGDDVVATAADLFKRVFSEMERRDDVEIGSLF